MMQQERVSSTALCVGYKRLTSSRLTLDEAFGSLLCLVSGRVENHDSDSVQTIKRERSDVTLKCFRKTQAQQIPG